MDYIYKSKMMKVWEVGLLKLAVLSIGIVMGALWPAFFIRYAVPLAILGLALGAYLIYIWFQK
jgi:hypothetical protein